MCDCMNMAGLGPDSFGNHHNKSCPLYAAEKFPYLFYYEDAVDAWVPSPDKIENIIDIATQVDENEIVELRFKRIDMTDAEIEAMPEV